VSGRSVVAWSPDHATWPDRRSPRRLKEEDLRSHGCPGRETGPQPLFGFHHSPLTKDARMDLARYIRDIPDFPKPGILVKDITPLLADPRAFQESIDRLAGHYAGQDIDAVAAAEARGFLFAAPLALQIAKPLVPLRKPGKLPYQTHALQYDLEYG